MGKVAVLSDALINKIAAGEVVERPASVVKELCENSIDAGAQAIRVALTEGGLAAISIRDDGCGMSRGDAQRSLLRHATSKLGHLDGLFEIQTKGFRGEALPAIAAVSRFTLTTSEAGAKVGTRLQLEGGGKLELFDAAPSGGTTLEVDDLFFNTPARRKFMRRSSTELAHCHEAVIRLALGHPEVAFFLEHEGKTLLASPACGADPRERIAAALGAEVHPHLLEVDERRLGIRVWGHVASPEFTLNSARGLYALVNRRYIRDRGINHAVQRAFRETLPPGRQPVAVLFIELDPRSVDVNVHPQKMEVRFADARGVYEAVLAALTRALKSSPWLAPKPDAAFERVPGAQYAMAVEQFLSRAQDGAFPEAAPLPFAGEGPVPGLDGPSPAFGLARPGINEAPPPGYFTRLRPLGLLGERFLICEGAGGTLVVLDPHAARERVRLHALRAALSPGGRSTAQRFLFAATVDLTLADARRMEGQGPVLEYLGLQVEPFGGTTFALKSVPPELVGADYRALISELLTVLPPVGTAPSLEHLGPALKVLACHAAGQLRREMSQDEIRALFAELEEADFHLSCVHGSVVVSELPLLELERRAR